MSDYLFFQFFRFSPLLMIQPALITPKGREGTGTSEDEGTDTGELGTAEDTEGAKSKAGKALGSEEAIVFHVSF
jgi:hypothetical protein